MSIEVPRLYPIADASFGDPVELAISLFSGGARLVQIRNKFARAREFHDQVESVIRLAPEGARVIVNDRVDVALLTNALGVHLGQSDLPCSVARAILGPNAILGLSTHDEEQARIADQDSSDYIAVGPIFPTASKTDAEQVIGLDRLSAICDVVEKPVVAIGGISLTNVSDVISAGARSVAVISDLVGHADVERRTREFLSKLEV